jgi:TonB-linked SusC/RagA family outer membrane protein
MQIAMAKSSVQNTDTQKMISLELKNEQLSQAFKRLEKLTDYKILFVYDQISHYTVSGKVEADNIEQALKQLIGDKPLDYTIDRQFIHITLKEKQKQTPNQRTPASDTPQNPQMTSVSGKVIDKSGEPLASVLVYVKGTPTGTLTDPDGAFSLTVDESQVITFSLICYRSVTCPVSAIPKQNWVVRLEEDPLALDEVIVTGYGEISKHELTGAAKRIEATDIMSDSRMSVAQMLAGQVAGMSVSLGSGEPSATPKIRIRGNASILGNKAPLWVLDGIILDDPVSVSYSDLNGDDAAYLIGNAIAGINPQDIESINVLKDAAAAALYGVRAGNGVIVVSTKKGKASKPQATYNGNFSINERVNYSNLGMMNAGERITLSQEIIAASLLYPRVPNVVGYEALYLDYLNKALTYDQFTSAVQQMSDRNTDWYDLLFRDAVTTNHTLSINGGTETATYYASLGYNNSPGTAIGSESTRYNGLLKLTSWLSKKLYVNFQISSSSQRNHGFYTGVNPDSWAYNTARTIPAYNDDGSYFFHPVQTTSSTYNDDQSAMVRNYLYEISQTGQTADVDQLNTKLDLQWNFYKGFRYKLSGSISKSNTTRVSTATEDSYIVTAIRGYAVGAELPGSDKANSSSLPYGGIYNNRESKQTAYTIRNAVAYNNTFNDVHTFSAEAISEIRTVKSDGFGVTIRGWFPEGQILSPTVTSSNYAYFRSSLSPSITDSEQNYLSWIGSGSYSYKDKLTGSFSIRADGSNQFGVNPKYRFLPNWSLGAKYTLTNEAFLKDNPLLNYLALRASYGALGSVDTNTSPDLVSTIRTIPYSEVGLWESYVSYYPNPDLRWEKVVTYNAGLDFSLFNGHISGSFDAYHKKTTDAIMYKQISAINGLSSYKINGGDIENVGYEIDLMAYPIKSKDWELGLGVIYGYNKNTLTKANDGKEVTTSDKLNGNALIVGEPLGTLYSYQFYGLDHDTGLPIFYDDEGKHTYIGIDDQEHPNYTLYSERAGLVKSGLLYAPHTGGLKLHARWKNFRLNADFAYQLGGVKRLPNLYNYSNTSSARVFDPMFNVPKELINRWKQPGDEEFTNIPALFNYQQYNTLANGDGRRPTVSYYDGSSFLTYSVISGTSIYDRSDIRVASTDNIRLNRLYLSYLMPRQWSRMFHIASMELSAQATNLFLIADKRWHGRDPEQASSANSTLPSAYTFNINITF